MKTMEELVKENTKLIQDNYNFATEIHECKRKIIALENRMDTLSDMVSKLQEIVMIQEQKITKLEEVITILQKQINELKH